MAKKVFSKEQIAIEELSDAINLFNQGRYFSSILLASASEEILAQMLKSKGNNTANAFDIEEFMFEATKDILKINNYYSYRNNTRNELKHHGDENNKDELSGNFKKIASTHISAAIINYKLNNGILPDNEIIKKYCLEKGIS
jgi:hypothetical protein